MTQITPRNLCSQGFEIGQWETNKMKGQMDKRPMTTQLGMESYE